MTPSLVLLVASLAQTFPPVVTPRGVVNAFTQQPAPSVASPGALISIEGINLGPTSEITASGLPLPKQLGGLEVRINDRPAALYSVSPDRILAQVPYDTPPGLSIIVVKRGDLTSRPARINLVPSLPSLRTTADSGFGPVVSKDSALSLTGLGPTDPALSDGDARSDAPPKSPLRVFIGGWPANARVTHSADQPGVFQLQLETPAKALPGDPIIVLQDGRRSNPAVLGSLAKPDSLFMSFPDGTPELRTILSSDLRATFLAATGVRASNGCYTGLLFDLAAKTSAKLPECLAADTANALTPFQAPVDNSVLASFVGPAKSQEEISDQVYLWNATQAEPRIVKLPAASRLLVSTPDGNLAALLTGNQAVTIDAASGEVKTLENPAGLFAGALQGALPGGGANLGAALPTLDLGNGLNKILTQPTGVGQGTRFTVVGDSTDDPTKAKIVALNPQNAVTQTRDFPDGWLPLAAPAPQGVGLPGGAQLPAALTRLSVTSIFDGPQRTYYVIARRADNSRHGLIAVRTDRDEVRALEFPDGWFATACTANIRFFNVELVRRFGFLASNSADRAFTTACSASGFLLFDLDDQKISAVPLPGAGQFSATQGTDEMNDYIFGSNIDPSRQGTADTLYMLDGVTGTAFRIDLPAGLSGFAQLRSVPSMNLLIGLARERTQPGDAGLVVFDLARGQGTLFPTPDGFTAVQIVDVFPATRKVIARGTRPGNTGTQLLIYDLRNGDLQVVENPDGVAFVGAPVAAAPGAGGGQPGQPGGPGQGGGQGGAAAAGVNLRANLRANAVIALTYSADRRQNGLLVVRLP